MKKILKTILIACLLLLTCACSDSNHYKENSKILKIENYIDYIKFDMKQDSDVGVFYHYVYNDINPINSLSEYAKVVHSIEDYLSAVNEEQGFTWAQDSPSSSYSQWSIYDSNNIKQAAVIMGTRESDGRDVLLVCILDR